MVFSMLRCLTCSKKLTSMSCMCKSSSVISLSTLKSLSSSSASLPPTTVEVQLFCLRAEGGMYVSAVKLHPVSVFYYAQLTFSFTLLWICDCVRVVATNLVNSKSSGAVRECCMPNPPPPVSCLGTAPFQFSSQSPQLCFLSAQATVVIILS